MAIKTAISIEISIAITMEIAMVNFKKAKISNL